MWEFYFVLALLPIAHALGVLRARSDALTLSALVAVVVLPFVMDAAGPQPDHTLYFVGGVLAALCTLLLAVATLRAQERTELNRCWSGETSRTYVDPDSGNTATR